ncbi:MAG TPA: hypothetical protein DCZ69_03270 [Syntrophobacteraceae bacterium]|nr:hypothetical protein [Syntrophobacteraceae bacterium]HBD07258.1 hypothetical protein [Syntrophobacteraceae bacterium]
MWLPQFLRLEGLEHLINVARYTVNDLKTKAISITEQIRTQRPTNQDADPFRPEDAQSFKGVHVQQNDFLAGRTTGGLLFQQENLGTPVEYGSDPGTEYWDGKFWRVNIHASPY